MRSGGPAPRGAERVTMDLQTAVASSMLPASRGRIAAAFRDLSEEPGSGPAFLEFLWSACGRADPLTAGFRRQPDGRGGACVGRGGQDAESTPSPCSTPGIRRCSRRRVTHPRCCGCAASSICCPGQPSPSSARGRRRRTRSRSAPASPPSLRSAASWSPAAWPEAWTRRRTADASTPAARRSRFRDAVSIASILPSTPISPPESWKTG